MYRSCYYFSKVIQKILIGLFLRPVIKCFHTSYDVCTRLLSPGKGVSFKYFLKKVDKKTPNKQKMHVLLIVSATFEAENTLNFTVIIFRRMLIFNRRTSWQEKDFRIRIFFQ